MNSSNVSRPPAKPTEVQKSPIHIHASKHAIARSSKVEAAPHPVENVNAQPVSHTTNIPISAPRAREMDHGTNVVTGTALRRRFRDDGQRGQSKQAPVARRHLVKIISTASIPRSSKPTKLSTQRIASTAAEKGMGSTPRSTRRRIPFTESVQKLEGSVSSLDKQLLAVRAVLWEKNAILSAMHTVDVPVYVPTCYSKNQIIGC